MGYQFSGQIGPAFSWAAKATGRARGYCGVTVIPKPPHRRRHSSR